VKLLDIQSSQRGEVCDSITLPKSIGEACRSENTSVVVITLMASGKAQLWRIVNASPDICAGPKAAMRNPSFGVRECAEQRGNTRMSFSYSTRAESEVFMSTRWTRPTIVTIWVCGCATAPFLALQAISPRLENPSVTAEIQAPPAVRDILKHSCYNCHSNETDLEWFDKIAPMSWLVANDVKRARKHLNFSEIGKLPLSDQRLLLFDAVNQIQLGAMPLESYRRVHPGSSVTPEKLETLRRYVASQAPPDASVSKDVRAAGDGHESSVSSDVSRSRVQDTAGGVSFNPDYKFWKQIGITERRDNNTIRVVLGNDVAVRAIADNHINPWPDGAILAKATWHEQGDGTEIALAGDFVQAEVMKRDSKKYRSTAGWGWGRWLGPTLTPDPKTADLRNACIDCHAPMRYNDYVFTMPMMGQQ
jgi:Haem-binding domain/Cytochrome P460